MSYSAYRLNRAWYVSEAVKIIFLGVLTGWLFYDSIAGGIAIACVAPVIWIKDKGQYISKRQRSLRGEFKDMIVLLSGSLNAGYSLENAFVRVYEDAVRAEANNGNAVIINDGLRHIVNGIHCNRRVEDMLVEFGAGSGVKEIEEFAELIAAAKHYGGNMIQMISQTAKNLSDRQMVENEISTILSAKQLEGRIMMLTPFFILLYMRFTNSGYIDILYSSLYGRIVMSVCLLLILISGAWIERIMRIEV